MIKELESVFNNMSEDEQKAVAKIFRNQKIVHYNQKVVCDNAKEVILHLKDVEYEKPKEYTININVSSDFDVDRIAKELNERIKRAKRTTGIR